MNSGQQNTYYKNTINKKVLYEKKRRQCFSIPMSTGAFGQRQLNERLSVEITDKTYKNSIMRSRDELKQLFYDLSEQLKHTCEISR